MNRKRVKHFNKILTQYPKRGQQFNMNDFKLYEDRAIAVQKTWKQGLKQPKQEMTEEDKRKKEEEHLRTVAYTALMDGTSIDSLINFRMKTPERWM